MSLYQTYLKRPCDLLLATVAFLLFLPIFIIVYCILYFTLNGKPFYCQQRPGKDERVFKIIKFKSMRDLKVDEKTSIEDIHRITKFGAFLRKYSLDEIPQLINVIKGDMSLVGPRPLLVSYLPYYNDFQKQRHHVQPGITGWAQVNGRNALNWEQRFAYDVWYVNNISFVTDIKILWLTVFKIFEKEGVYNQNNAINEEFRGTPTHEM